MTRPIYDFSDYSTSDLEKAMELINKLDMLGFDLIDDDAVFEISGELDERYKRGDKNDKKRSKKSVRS